jgi:hypothetical protein
MAYAYSVLMNDQTVAAAATLILVRPPAATSLRIVRVWASQKGSTTSTQVKIQLGRKASAFPTTLTSFTPLKMDEKDAVSTVTGGTSGAAGTAGVLATAEGAGTFTSVIADAFNSLTGYLWVPGPREEIIVRANSAEAFVVRFPEAPGVTLNWTAGLIYEEM